MPSRWPIARRTSSRTARHSETPPWSCVGELRLCIEPSALRGRDWIVVQRCLGCGKVVEVTLVNDDDEATGWQDAPEYQDPDPGPYGV